MGPAEWHGSRVAIVRRKCSKHFVSNVRLRHEGVIVQLYAVRFHVRNIDGAKQWPDITGERNLGHRFSFLPRGNVRWRIFFIKTRPPFALWLIWLIAQSASMVQRRNSY